MCLTTFRLQSALQRLDTNKNPGCHRMRLDDFERRMSLKPKISADSWTSLNFGDARMAPEGLELVDFLQ
jgi:hypothetical protein